MHPLRRIEVYVIDRGLFSQVSTVIATDAARNKDVKPEQGIRNGDVPQGDVLVEAPFRPDALYVVNVFQLGPEHAAVAVDDVLLRGPDPHGKLMGLAHVMSA